MYAHVKIEIHPNWIHSTGEGASGVADSNMMTILKVSEGGHSKQLRRGFLKTSKTKREKKKLKRNDVVMEHGMLWNAHRRKIIIITAGIRGQSNKYYWTKWNNGGREMGNMESSKKENTQLFLVEKKWRKWPDNLSWQEVCSKYPDRHSKTSRGTHSWPMSTSDGTENTAILLT